MIAMLRQTARRPHAPAPSTVVAPGQSVADVDVGGAALVVAGMNVVEGRQIGGSTTVRRDAERTLGLVTVSLSLGHDGSRTPSPQSSSVWIPQKTAKSTIASISASSMRYFPPTTKNTSTLSIATAIAL